MNTEKKLSDYLPFYLGQKVRWHYVDYDKDTWTIWETLTPRVLAVKLDDHSVDGIQIQARRLSSMTDPEAVEIYNELYPGIDQPDDRKAFTIKAQCSHKGLYWEGSVSMVDYVAWFPLLIKKGFWLWDDSWFTEGLIIDADTIK